MQQAPRSNEIHLHIEQGSEWSLNLVFKGKDLTGWAALAQGRPVPGGSLRWECVSAGREPTSPDDPTIARGSAEISFDGIDSRCLLHLPGRETLKLGGGGVYDVVLIDPEGRPYRAFRGRYTLDPAVTVPGGGQWA